jgi:hypothetical protein
MSTGIRMGNVLGFGVAQVTFNPASVAAATSAEQTITVPGVKTTDMVFVSKPSLTAGLGIANARVSAADTVSVTFINATAGALDAGSESYTIMWVRPESVVGTVVD